MKRVLLITVLLCVCVTPQGFGQSSNARVSGTVTDASGAVLPGVEVTATNSATGIVNSVVSNEAGAYNLASLLPGAYTISASLPSFQTQTFRDVQVGNAAQVRLNFSLMVGGVSQSVEVSVAASQILLESSSSVGNVLEQRQVSDLPLVSNRVLDLVGVMAGVQVTNNPIFGANDTQFAGVAAANINVQRDGIPVTGGRWPTGLDSTTEVNPDLVGEVRMILAPVDAEMGRGSGQFQIQTRSGTNAFHGAGVWNAQNSALDAKTWSDNRTGATAPWRNMPNLVGSIGGPIVRNKTHFFALYDQQWARTRAPYTAGTLTPCAQRGIFRYYDNWNSAAGTAFTAPTWATLTSLGATPTTAVINADGSLRAPTTNPDGTAHNGQLRFQSVFGTLQNIPTRPDCSDAVVSGGARDPFRTQKDTTGFVDTLFKFMPAANNYDIGDGLNTAGHRWTRGLDGADNLFGIGEPTRRKQYNGKIDHVFSQSHKISSAYSYESTYASDTFMTWPGTYDGHVRTKPQVLTMNFTSTLSPNLVNEARVGMTRMGTNVYATLYNPDYRDEILALMPKSGNTTFLPLLGAGQVNFQIDQIVGTRGFTPQPILRDSTPRKVVADTVSFTTGKHTFRFGGEFRRGSSLTTVSSTGNATFPACGQFNGFNGDPTTPIAYGGATPLAPVTGITGISGLSGNAFAGNVQRMENLLMFLSGSLCGIAQYRFINSPDQASKAWNDPAQDPFKTRDFQQNEFGSFFKDDWKVSKNVTLNLGVRWDYYGPPWEKNGLTATLKDTGGGLFGISGRGFESWMSPGASGGALSELIFVGPKTPNPGLSAYPRDLNNWGPAVGFAWNPQSGTTIRGGYQMQYIGGGNFSAVEDRLGSPPGSTFIATYSGDSSTPYLDMTSLRSNRVPLPIAPPVLPVQQIPITNRATAIQAYDPNYVSPYIQNLTVSITHDLTSKFTVDARYIGTLTRKNFSSVDINSPNFLGNGLKQAFDAARAGGESDLLNRMFNGINIAGVGFGAVGTTLNTVPQTGALHLRNAAASNLRNNLANGNYSALATSLASLNYSTLNPGNQNLPFVPFGVNGSVLRQTGFPENFILTNPQFSTATFQTNGAHSNYHSVQALGKLRNVAGFSSLEASYTWSKNLGVGSAGFTDPRNQALDYALLSTHRTHVFRTYGTFDLPIGPGKFLARNAGGVFARIIEGWQTSWIVNLNSGLPMTINGASMLYGRGTPDQVRPFDFKEARGVQWADGAPSGFYFGDIFGRVPDPQCAAIEASLRSSCTLSAITEKSSGNIILQNAQPGTRGNVGLQTIEGAGVWTADMQVAKAFRISEGVRATIRLDAKNVFNHPTPGAPGAGFGAAPNDGGALLNLNDFNPFGAMTLKGASVPQFPAARQFQLKMRVDF